MQTVCTIVSSDYLPYARALHASLLAFDSAASLQVLVVDAEQKDTATIEGLTLWSVMGLINATPYQEVYKRYGHRQTSDEFRWALKPVFLAHLLTQGFDKVIYTDADIFFFNSPAFLFDLLNHSSILLCPHWRSIDPLHFDDLAALLKDGYFNAGFVGASQKGMAALNWWAGACVARMEKSATLGIYDDQKYLDILPHEFDHVQVLEHRGCNIAYWNMDVNRRSIKEGKLLIAGCFEPVFVHFTTATIRHIQNGNDGLLLSYLKKYLCALAQQGLTIQNELAIAAKTNFLVRTKRKLLLRTRLKRFFYYLSEKL